MKHLSIGEAAATLGVATSTLRRWEQEGKLIPCFRTPGNHRRYAWPQLQALIHPELDKPKKTVCYARVSSHDQKADLQRQVERLQRWCHDQNILNPEILQDLGSGLNYKKKGLKTLIRMIALQQMDHLVILHKDRLLRFGSELLFELCRLNGIKVTIVEAVQSPSYEQQVTADVIELMTVFSARLYGSRSHKNRKKKAA